MSNRLVHFEIHAADPGRAAKFYSDVFGWEVSKWGDMEYWVVMAGKDPKKPEEPGINGGMLLRKGEPPAEGQPVNAYVCIIDVKDVDETTQKVLAASGTIALEKISLPGVGDLAYYKDTEGNIFGVNKPPAK